MSSENQINPEIPSEANSDCISLEFLASQFMEEHRRWMNPSIEKYAADYPDHSKEIRESFPILIAMEQWKGNQEFSQLKSQLPDPRSIKQLGDCRIIREINRSRASILYEGVQGNSNRRVAVKLLPWKSEMTPRWRERFERESRLVARLRHENIVTFYRTGEDQGYFYSVMQLINGVGLNRVIGKLAEMDETHSLNNVRPLGNDRTQEIAQALQKNNWSQFAKIGLEAAQALSYAHNRKTLHNDIKPENILIDSEGHTWVNNFKLAQVAEGDFKQQSARTLCYKAPERFNGQLSEQCDLYSLGMVLYELATLTPAFSTQSSTEIVDHILTQDPPHPRTINHKIPTEFEMIILNCIAKQTQQRYQSAEELSMDLVRFLNGKKVKHRVKPHRIFSRKWFTSWRFQSEQSVSN
ncbi:MAG: serine/threonine-protein kinase [Gimesia sp.]|nr:serine/threonine-protein kinase [Gimesia sp.]